MSSPVTSRWVNKKNGGSRPKVNADAPASAAPVTSAIFLFSIDKTSPRGGSF
jgi:hypothetical protein